MSSRPQTTRRRVAGVADGEDWQFVLLDLPGFQRPRDGLTDRMQRAVDETLADVDAVLLVLDATTAVGRRPVRCCGRVDELCAGGGGAQQGRPGAARAHRGAAGRGRRARRVHAVHPVSARTGDGVAALRDELVTLAPDGPPLYPVGTRSGDPLRLRIAELVREQALRLTRQEVPHAVAVVVDEHRAWDSPARRPGRGHGGVRDGVAARDPGRQGRLDDPRDRDRGAPGDRAGARRAGDARPAGARRASLARRPAPARPPGSLRQGQPARPTPPTRRAAPRRARAPGRR